MPRGKPAATQIPRPQAKPLILTAKRPIAPLSTVVTRSAALVTSPIANTITTVPLVKTPTFKYAASNLAAVSDLIRGIPENSLIVTDLDNTLMEPAQLVGSDQWFEAHLKHTKDIQQTVKIYNYVHEHSAVIVVEPDTVEVVNDWKQKHKMIGLTTRGGELAMATIRQLDSIGIRFAPVNSNVVCLNEMLQDCPDSYATDGIIFAGGRSKGMCLEAYLKAMQINTKNIPHLVFIDDKKGHVDNVSAMAERLGIPSTCIRYAYLDHKISKVHLPTAAVQLALHPIVNRFYSDEEAEVIASYLKSHGFVEPAVDAAALGVSGSMANSTTTTTTTIGSQAALGNLDLTLRSPEEITKLLLALPDPFSSNERPTKRARLS